MGYDWNFSFLQPYAGAFLRGTWVTIELSVLSFVAGTLAGLPLGMLLRLKRFGIGFLLLNDALRAIPILVLLFFVYYFPYQALLHLPAPGPLGCAILAMAVSQAAYTADLVRAAVDGVPRRAILGGRALGLREKTIFRYIVLPDIIRQMLPAQVAFFIGIVRLSSIASVIGAEEIVYVARLSVSQNFRSMEAWVVVAIIYIILVVPMTIAHRRLESSQWLKRRA